MIILFNIAFYSSFSLYHIADNPKIVIEPLSSYFIIATLTGLIIISLLLTFYKKGSPIHKMLGLLLLSIFVVFLWIIQTQFLFIYLVYILAFISAVLMLFLSVILMLPISSTISYKSVKHISFSFMLLFIDEFLLLWVILFLLFTFILFNISLNKNVLLLFNNIMSYLRLFLWSLNNKNEQIFYSEKTRRTYIAFKNNKIFLMLFSKFYFYFNKYYHFKNTSFLNLFRKIFIIFMFLVIDVLQLLIIKFPAKMYFYLKSIVAHLKTRLSWLDNIVQVYLFTNILAIASLSYDIKSIKYIDFINQTFDEKVLGLGALKNLLYNQEGSFLIISTLVLLIALIGAAIMTKKH